MLCTLETPPVAGRGPHPGTVRLRMEALEDWQVELDDGSIRGGFTTRAQALIADREGWRVPRHVRAMVARMID